MPEVTSTSSTQILVSKCHAPIKEHGLLGEMTDFKAGEEKFNKTSLEHCVVPESKEEPKKNETVS